MQDPLKDPSVVEPPAPEPSLEPRPPGSDPAPAAILLPGQGVVKGRVSGKGLPSGRGRGKVGAARGVRRAHCPWFIALVQPLARADRLDLAAQFTACGLPVMPQGGHDFRQLAPGTRTEAQDARVPIP